VIESGETPGGCWAHFSSVLVPGFRALPVGQPVNVEYESAEQDGYSFRAVEVWPADQTPYRAETEPVDGSQAYHSTLTITGDGPEQTGRA
jgi:cold shock protein